MKNPSNTKPLSTGTRTTHEVKMHGGKTTNKLILFLLLISIITYANTVDHGYVYDDFSVIPENTIVTKGLSAIPEILSTPYRWGFFRTSNDMYRPLSLVMFAAEYEAFDGNPVISHFMNIAIYACCVLLLFIFFDTLFDKKKTAIAFIASLLFALHPVHTEVVANIKSRDELLCFLFAILSLNIFIRYIKDGNIRLLIAGSILYFLSLLSKETSIALLGIIPILFFLYKNEDYKRSMAIVASCLLAVGIFLTIRYLVLASHNADNVTDVIFIDNFLAGAPSVSSKIATAILVLGMYLKLLFVPYPLICDYSFNSIPFVDMSNIWVLLTMIIYITLLSFSIVRLVKFRKDPLALGILFYLFTIALFSNLLLLTGTAMAERFLFFASAGFCWTIVVLVERFGKILKTDNTFDIIGNKKILWVIAPLSLLYFLITVNRNVDWSDNLTLFRADIEKAPENAKLNLFLGNELFKEMGAENIHPAIGSQRVNEAMRYIKTALRIYPSYNDACKTLAKGYYVTGLYDSAEYYYKKALDLAPHDMETWGDLDVVYFRSGKFQQSISVCKKMLSIDSNATYKYKDISTCFMHLSQYDSSIYYLKAGIPKVSDALPLYKDLSLAYKLHNEKDSALKYQTIVQRTEPMFGVY